MGVDSAGSVGRAGFWVFPHCLGLLCPREMPQRGLVLGGTPWLFLEWMTPWLVWVWSRASLLGSPPPPLRPHGLQPGTGSPETCVLLLAMPIMSRVVTLWGLHLLVCKMGIKTFTS